MIVFIPRSGDECKPAEADNEWLPRQCPTCWQTAVIGHGRRRRPAHDANDDWIVVRRGICKVCRGTVTVLPSWCVPGAPYSLWTRQQAVARLAGGTPAEEAGPYCCDPNRLPDASTVRRWFRRRLASLPFLAWTPTTLAWDWRAVCRKLAPEAISP